VYRLTKSTSGALIKAFISYKHPQLQESQSNRLFLPSRPSSIVIRNTWSTVPSQEILISISQIRPKRIQRKVLKGLPFWLFINIKNQKVFSLKEKEKRRRRIAVFERVLFKIFISLMYIHTRT
jgi:hypothetical protein